MEIEGDGMNEHLYCVENEYGSIIARDMNLDNAMIFVRALFETYFNEDDPAFTIKRQMKDCEVVK